MPDTGLSSFYFITDVGGEKNLSLGCFPPTHALLRLGFSALRLGFVYGKHYSEVVSCLKQLVFNLLMLRIHKT